MRNYRCNPLDSRGVLFRAQDSAVSHLYEIDSKMGWDGLFTRGLDIVDVPGDHFSLLDVPRVLTLAERFQEYLRTATKKLP